MPRITRLEPQRDPDRLNVYVDGTFAFGVSSLVALSHHLVEARKLAPDEIESLRQDEAAESAYGAVLNFLSFRPRSRDEIERYLRRKQVDAATIDTVVERLGRAGLIDDGAFAQYWVENRQTFRPRGARALRMEMRQKGLASEIIDDALESLGDEEELAYQAGLKKGRALVRLDEAEYMRKMVPLLQRRGFSYRVAAGAARRIREELLDGES